MTDRPSRPLLALGATVLLVLSCASLAFADEISRPEYKAAVEPICLSNTKANERILSDVRREVKSGKLKTAATKFGEASAALKKALRELEQVPGPTQDEARLASWFRYVKVEAELFSAAGKKLKSGNKAAAEHIVVQLTQNANKANLQVLPFGFHYCRLEPARFT